MRLFFVVSTCFAFLGCSDPGGDPSADLTQPGDSDLSVPPGSDLAVPPGSDLAVPPGSDLAMARSTDMALPPLKGSVNESGGSVSRMYFAVVGDTRPANLDQTSAYPSDKIGAIYGHIAALSPAAQFVVATGDYMFADNATDAKAQMAKYMTAANQYLGKGVGPLFAALGNHECAGYTDSNCAGGASTNNRPGVPTANMNAFTTALVTPLKKTNPYYSIPINDIDGKWTAKLVVTACNAWDATQKGWLTTELSRATTYTLIARHEPLNESEANPCTTEMDAIVAAHPYDLMLVGHSHEFYHPRSSRELIIGTGGAPLSPSTTTWSYATVEQQSSGFLIRQFDYMTNAQLQSFTIP